MKHFHHDSTPEKLHELNTFIKATKSNRARDRARAIQARMQGASRDSIASVLRIHKDTISNWITLYRKHGIASLLDKPQKGNRSKLSYQQREHVKYIVLHRTPKQLGFEQEYWDLACLSELIFKLYQIRFKVKKSYQSIYRYIGF